jgi:Uncharacterised nucleotidyltransferase
MLTSSSPEFRLVVACCIWPTTQRSIAAIKAAANDEVNWEAFLRVVRRHRVFGLVLEALVAANVPLQDPVLATLKTRVQQNLRQNVNSLMESHHLQNRFNGAEIPIAFVKGVCVAMRVFTNLAMRQSKDIDLLVRPQDVENASAILDRAGYQRIQPPPTMVGNLLQRWYRLNNQTEWMHPRTRQQVELHWHLTQLKGLLREPLVLHRDFREVRLSSEITLRTIVDDRLFVYLCVHGAGHAWSRLKWLADVAALLSEMSDGEIEDTYRAAWRSGDGRAVGQALMLCERLFCTRVPRHLSEELQRDRIQRCLVWCAMRAMTRGKAQVEVHDLSLGPTLVSLSNILLLPTWRLVVAQLLTMSVSLNDLVEVPLPRSLHVLYPLLRLPLWLWRRTHTLRRSLRSQ